MICYTYARFGQRVQRHILLPLSICPTWTLHLGHPAYQYLIILLHPIAHRLRIMYDIGRSFGICAVGRGYRFWREAIVQRWVAGSGSPPHLPWFT